MRVINAVSLCEDGFGFVAGADRGNISVRKPPVPMFQAVVVSSFFRRVGIVFGFSADAKVRGVDARRVVASVHNHFIIGDRPNIKLIRVPMSANRLFTGKKKDAVTVTVTSAFPFPTTVCFFKAAFKNIIRAKNRIFRKAISSSCPRVAASAQLSRYNFWGITFHAIELNTGVVSHLIPPVRQFYAITEV